MRDRQRSQSEKNAFYKAGDAPTHPTRQCRFPKDDPKAEEFYNLGGQKYDKEDYRGAIEACDRAIGIDPNYADGYNDRGNARSILGDNQGAIGDYDQALKINPNYSSPKSLSRLGYNYMAYLIVTLKK
ncbi:tetratricopeptide repeat protein [Microcoleus sp. ARI1-B5]|uniref:tetratricopeptide repeat protein n=1 Tax=unclassified Microcoleus TaxID=2642155 RepID=UPI002FD779E5